MLFPKKFREILEIDQEKLSIVDKTASDFSKILEANKLEFFPDYTDHGIKHVESVLKTAEHLITDDSFEYLKPIDVTLIILSVILHDIGMHITHPGFLKLLKGDFDVCMVNDFDKLNWQKNWQSFMQEARKFNQNQLLDIFGDKNAVINEPPVKNLSEYDKKLIGEFIRRNHPRLAHEIAINGFPSAEGNNIEFAHGLGTDIKDLAGLIARSHGISLRSTFNYLENKYQDNWRNPYEAKIIYIMGLLRIADYIQINSDRANQIILRTKILSSPKSKQEWEKNNAVKFVSYNLPDPELINVHAQPQNSLTFLELSKLFKDIQNEFDLTWAILGEVYGRNDEYKKLKYKFRRIKSNIDNIEKFSETIDYVPEKVIFDAEPELLKLLVGPLYGKDPTYGVRELLQNAVDACRERQFLIEKQFGTNSKEYQDYKPEIKISIKKEQDENYYFTIEDNGIGMTKDILINYFFKAGASFINSDVWKKDFVDEKGSMVQRSGRFGVGVLASFLLGDEIEVTTKSIDCRDAFKLIASIDSKQIEILKSIFDIGTKIKIILRKENKLLINNVKNKKAYKLNWFQWYKIRFPNIVYNLDDDIKDVFTFNEEKENIPDYNENNNKWRVSYPQKYYKIMWTIGVKHYSDKIFCNGFLIPEEKMRIPIKNSILDFKISIFDFNAKLPLSLNRNYLDGDHSFLVNLILEDLCKDFISKLLTLKIKKPLNSLYYRESIVIDYDTPINLSEDLIYQEEGYFLFCSHILKRKNINSFSYIWLTNPYNTANKFCLNNNIICYLAISKSIESFKYRVDKLNNAYSNIKTLNNLFSLKSIGFKRIILKKERFAYLFDHNKKRVSEHFKYSHIVEKNNSSENWMSLITRTTKSLFEEINFKIKSKIDFKELEKSGNNIDLIIEVFYSEPNYSTQSDSYLVKLIDKYLSPDYIIPYDMEERKKKFPKAFKELARFIKNYE